MVFHNGYDRAFGNQLASPIDPLSSAPADLIHHADRGGQYASRTYRSILSRASMRQSMSRAGDCYDNAFMESCFGTIKTELQMTEYQNYEKALNELSEYIEYNNYKRLHSSIGYLWPRQFEDSVC